MKIAVIGGVRSTEILVRNLVKHGFRDCSVWGYYPAATMHVSGWCDLGEVCTELDLPFQPFRKLAECEESLRAAAPDILFVVGLSQIVPASMLAIAKRANVGFHPTALPKGRGRAAMAWIILLGTPGAASFFKLGDSVDDGAIYVQEPFEVAPDDDVAAVEAKVLLAETRALDRWLPELKRGSIEASEQNHAEATWLGRRAPEDGWLDWSRPRADLLKLIQASAPPHPGAYTFHSDRRLEILSASLSDRRETGVVGRIVSVGNDGGFEVQCGDALLFVKRWRCDTGWQPKVGMRLGYYVESEVFELRKRVAALEAQIAAIYQGSKI